MRLIPGLLALCLVPFLSGCSGPPASNESGSPSEPRSPATEPNATATHTSLSLATPGPGTFWFVDVVGSEVAPWNGAMCDRGFAFVVRPERREVEVDPAVYPIDPARVISLVALSVDDPSGCGLAHHVQANHQVLPLFPGDREVRVFIDEETGSARVEQGLDRYDVAPGDRLELTTQVTFVQANKTVQLSIVNHGAWDKAGLHVTEDGTYW